MQQTIKIALYQMNSTVGDLINNTNKLLQQIKLAKTAGADLFLAPELAICGYPPQDLLLRPAFYSDCQAQLERLLAIDGITMAIGCPAQIANDNFNSLFVIRDGVILGRYDKMLLPNYGVFDECRYFTPGSSSLVVEINQVRCGFIICEDVWDTVAAAEAAEHGAQLILVANSSPFEVDKYLERLKIASYRVEETQLPLIYLNQVGGQDELVFDGGSFALNADSSLLYQAPINQESLFYIQYQENKLSNLQIECGAYPDPTQQMYSSLELALRDYVAKNGFSGIVLGLSGGIDSALVLALAVDAIGRDKVLAVMLPSIYTAEISLSDAREMVNLLGVRYEEISIKPLVEQFNQSLTSLFANLAEDVTEENIQARVRGTLLMALSNKFAYLLVSTGNKSEMATGYATLYGDMAGGFALLKDVTKTQVYQLANWRNQQHRVIPERIITRAPSAELRANQCDQDSLPTYANLDAIIEYLVNDNLASDDVINLGYMRDEVELVTRLLKNTEYKRRQAAVGPKVSKTAFASDWRYPISSKYKF